METVSVVGHLSAVESSYLNARKLHNLRQKPSKHRISDNVNVVQLREKIHNEILAQVKEFLTGFFEKNPEAVERISKGEIPEYFNVDNTTRRILNIYFSRFEEGQNKEEFVAHAKDIIKQAYGDVEGLVRELPEIVFSRHARKL